MSYVNKKLIEARDKIVRDVKHSVPEQASDKAKAFYIRTLIDNFLNTYSLSLIHMNFDQLERWHELVPEEPGKSKTLRAKIKQYLTGLANRN